MGSMRWTAVALLLLCTLPQLHTAPDDVRPGLYLQSTSTSSQAQLPCPQVVAQITAHPAAEPPPTHPTLSRVHTLACSTYCARTHPLISPPQQVLPQAAAPKPLSAAVREMPQVGPEAPFFYRRARYDYEVSAMVHPKVCYDTDVRVLRARRPTYR